MQIDETSEFASLHLDRARIGTPLYDGEAYFWAYEYRYPMRDLTRPMRKAVHDRLLRSGLTVDGCSINHQRVIDTFCNRKDVQRRLSWLYGSTKQEAAQ